MPELWLEVIWVIASGFYFLRTVYQIKATHDEKRSVTPLLYWSLTLVGSLLIIYYGISIGSWAIPLGQTLTLISVAYNIKIEKEREFVKV